VVTREHMKSDVRLGVRTPWLPLAIAVSMVLSGCASHESPRPVNPLMVVVYRVEFPGGEEGRAKITYRLPDGSIKLERVSVPWTSPRLYFSRGSPMEVTAEAIPRSNVTQLECKAIPEPENPEGALAAGSGPGSCRTKARVGSSPFNFPD
jgi:hypothetical protein